MDERAKEVLVDIFKNQECKECTLSKFCNANEETVCSILVNKYSEVLRKKKK